MAQSILRKRESLQFTAPSSMRFFMIIWFGQVISYVGSGMTCFAQSVTVYTDLGGTITHLMLLAALAQLPGILVSPLAGVLVDRWDRRWVMIISDTVAALATMTLRILVVSDSFQLWQMYVIVVIISIANHFQWPAFFASVPLIVPKDRLGYANGLLQVGRSLGAIVAPLMAGVAVSLFRLEGVILFDMGTYLFALFTLFLIRIPRLPPATVERGKQGSLVREAMYGWSYLFERRGLLSLLMLFGVANYVFATVAILVIPLALSLEPISLFGLTIEPAQILGGTLSLGGVSSLAGGITMGSWGGPKRRVYGVLGFLLLQGLGLMFIGVQPSILFLLVGYMMITFATPFVNACSGVIWQSKVAPEVQGRVLAASSMSSTTALEIGYLSSGPLADHVFIPLVTDNGVLVGSVGRVVGTGTKGGLGFMFVTLGSLVMLAVAGGYLYPRLRRVDEELPDVFVDEFYAQAPQQTPSLAWQQIDLMAE